MTYTATFYVLRPDDLSEVVLTVHQVTEQALEAYTHAPSQVLAAVKSVVGEPKAQGFRVTDAEGRIVLDYVDRIG